MDKSAADKKIVRSVLRKSLIGFGGAILVVLILYNALSLGSSSVELIPEPMAELFPAPLLIGLILFFAGFGFYLNQKNSRR